MSLSSNALDLLNRDFIPPDLVVDEEGKSLGFPQLPDWLQWYDLGLRVRTRSRIASAAAEPRDLCLLTVGALLDISGFGVRSLFDLLTAIQSWQNPPVLSAAEAHRQFLPALPIGATVESLPVAETTRLFMQRILTLGIISDLSEMQCVRVSQIRGVNGFTSEILTDLRQATSGRRVAEAPGEASGEAGSIAGQETYSTRLPAVPTGLRWEDLQLPYRARTRLARLYERPSDLAGQPVLPLLSVEGFGAKSAAELVRAMESHAGTPTKEGAATALHLAERIARSGAARGIRNDDVRFGCHIQALAPGAPNAAEMAEQVRQEIVTHGIAPWQKDHLQEFAEHLGRVKTMTLEAELADVLARLPHARHREIVARLWGWDGRGGVTLRGAGAEFGFSGERVRQIMERALKIVGGPHFVPMLDAVLETVAAEANRPAAEIMAALRSKGLTAGLFEWEGLVRAAAVFERTLRLQPQSFQGTPLIVDQTWFGIEASVSNCARAAVGLWGVGSLSDITEQASREVGSPVDQSVVRRILESYAGFRWVDQPNGWFCLTALARNALFLRIERVLSIAPRVRVAELRAAIARDLTQRGSPITEALLLALCAHLPWCRVDGEYIEAVAPLDPAHVLAPAEFSVWRVLHKHGGILPLDQLEFLCLSEGVKRPSLWQQLSFSPIICKFAREVWGLVGVQPKPEAIATMIPPWVRSAQVLGHGSLSDKHAWIGFRLTPSMARKGFFSVPISMVGVIPKHSALAAPDDSDLGDLGIRETNGWGLAEFYRATGAKAGDYVLLRFDLAAQRATAYLDPACPSCGRKFKILPDVAKHLASCRPGQPPVITGEPQPIPGKPQSAAAAPITTAPASAPVAANNRVAEHLKSALQELTQRQREIDEQLSRIGMLQSEKEVLAKQIGAVRAALQAFAVAPKDRSPERRERRAQQKPKIQTFVIDSENRITAFDSAEAAAATLGERFGNWSELVALAATWPAQRLVSLWNGLPGIRPVKRFQDRQEGVFRIWKRLLA